MNRKPRVLVVDDEALMREVLMDVLTSFGYEVELAQDALEALAKLALDIDLIMMDIVMPGMDGYTAVRRIRSMPEYQNLPIVMITGLTSREDRIKAIEAGANEFIAKPFDNTEVRVRTASLIKMKGAFDQLTRNQVELEALIEKRTTALRKALDEIVSAQRLLREANLETIHRLVTVTEYKDDNTAAHIRRMSQISALLAQNLSLPPMEVELILYASPMHDIGKVATPPDILLKPDKLTSDEWDLMKQHTTIGAQILRDSESQWLQIGEIIALTHHERWDGSGYPYGISGDDIPLWGRICAVADVFDALISERPYKKAYSTSDALQIIQESRGTHFDPDLVDTLIDNKSQLMAIQTGQFSTDYLLKSARK